MILSEGNVGHCKQNKVLHQECNVLLRRGEATGGSVPTVRHEGNYMVMVETNDAIPPRAPSAPAFFAPKTGNSEAEQPFRGSQEPGHPVDAERRVNSRRSKDHY